MHTLRRTANVLLSLGVGVAALTAVGEPANGVKPSRGCDHSTWTASAYPLDWAPGDDFDPVGANTLWQATLAGLLLEFGSLEAAEAAFGVEGIDGFAALALAGNQKYDRNLDGVVCWKEGAPGQPAYFFNAVDNTSNGGG